MPQQIKKSLVISIYFALAFSTLLVFWQVRNFDFVNYDDDIYVYENPHVLNGLTADAVAWAFTTGYANFWHPLTWLSYMLDNQLFCAASLPGGLNPAGFHLTNLVFHIVNTLLLFFVLKQMTNAVWQSAFVAALFALHPLHVESVAWIAERKDVLSTFFWILTMWAYLRYVKQPNIWRYLLTMLIFALGLMAKPMLITLPFVLLLLDYWPFQRKMSRRLLVEKIPFIILSIAFSAVAFLVQRGGGAVMELTDLGLKYRIYNAFISYIIYIGKMFWPSRLAVFYPHQFENVSVLYAVISALVLLALTILVLRFAKNHRYLVTGWFWYLGTLLPVIGLIQVGGFAMADRYTYITLTGLFIIIAWGLPRLFSGLPHQRVVPGVLMVLVLTTLGICAHRQTSYWKNSFTIFSHAIEVTPNNFIAHNNLGNAYSHLGRNTEAIEEFSQAVKIEPHFGRAYFNLGFSYGNLGRWTEAIDAFKRAVEVRPDYAEAYNNIGNAYGELSRRQDAIDAYRQAVRIKPDYVLAHYNLGNTYLAIGDKNSALAEYNILKSLKSKFADNLLKEINK